MARRRPDGMEVVELAPQTYLVFGQIMDGGPPQPQMLAAAREIWGERLPKSGYRLVQAPDLEFYPDDSTPDQAGAKVEWWVPVEGKDLFLGRGPGGAGAPGCDDHAPSPRRPVTARRCGLLISADANHLRTGKDGRGIW